MVCIPEKIFEYGNWIVMEWRDANNLKGSGFFKIIDDKIKIRKGYWDNLTFSENYKLPILAN